jgi:putative SbcD/Mre11-related phosphoesterase
MDKVEIAEGVYIIDLGLYLEKERTLIFSDFHLGYEESLATKGVLVPRFQYKDTSKRVGKILESLKKVDKIIVAGDLKHEFGIVSRQEWGDALDLLDFMSAYAKEIILIRGNHDTLTEPIARQAGVKVTDKVELGNVCIAHGDNIQETNAKTIVIGHEHPAITLTDEVNAEKVKCFIKGKYKRKTLIVIPSFNLVQEGTNILSRRHLSPYLDNINNFEVYVIADKVRYFGKVKNLMEHK